MHLERRERDAGIVSRRAVGASVLVGQGNEANRRRFEASAIYYLASALILNGDYLVNPSKFFRFMDRDHRVAHQQFWLAGPETIALSKVATVR